MEDPVWLVADDETSEVQNLTVSDGMDVRYFGAEERPHHVHGGGFRHASTVGQYGLYSGGIPVDRGRNECRRPSVCATIRYVLRPSCCRADARDGAGTTDVTPLSVC